MSESSTSSANEKLEIRPGQYTQDLKLLWSGDLTGLISQSGEDTPIEQLKEYYGEVLRRAGYMWSFEEIYNQLGKKLNKDIQFSTEKGYSNFAIIREDILNFLKERFLTHELPITLFKSTSRLPDTYTQVIYLDVFTGNQWDQEKLKNILNSIFQWTISQGAWLQKIHEIYYPSRITWANEKKYQLLKALNIFQTEREYIPNWKNISDNIIQDWINQGLKFKKDPQYNTLYIFSGEWVLVDSVDLGDATELTTKIKEAIKNYKRVTLVDYIALEIDQEKTITPGYIVDTELSRKIEVPEKYAKLFSLYSQKWYSFKLIDIDNDAGYTLFVMKNWYVVYDVNNSNRWIQWQLYLDQLFNELEKIDTKYWAWSQDRRIKDPELNIQQLQKQKVLFINTIYDSIYDNTGKIRDSATFDWTLSIQSLISIGIEQWLPLAEVLRQIPLIMSKLQDRGINVAAYYLKNLSRIPNDYSFLSQYELTEKDYLDTRNAFTSMYFNLITSFVDRFPHLALERFEELVNAYAKKSINFYQWDELNDRDWSSNNLIWYFLQRILDSVEDIDSTRNSEKVQKLFNYIPGLEERINSGMEQNTEKRRMLGWTSWTTLDDFDNSIWAREIEVIRYRIKNEWITGSSSEKDRQEIKFAIARNLHLQYLGKSDELNKILNNSPEALIKENLRRIIEQRNKIWAIKLFAQDVYHMAHYGQDDVDYIGNIPTQQWLRRQSSWYNYQLFDAKGIYTKNLREWKMEVQKYYESYITNPRPAMLLLEWHGDNELFSILNKRENTDKLWINAKMENINLDYKKLADIVIHRQREKDKNWITEPDTIVFAACRGDFAISFYHELHNRRRELSHSFIPPIMITAAENWQNSIFKSTNEDISYNFLREGLRLWGNTPSTYKTFFDNQHNPEIWSNPSLFYPIEVDGKWYPQQIW